MKLSFFKAIIDVLGPLSSLVLNAYGDFGILVFLVIMAFNPSVGLSLLLFPMFSIAAMILASVALDVVVEVAELVIWSLGKVIKGVASGVVLVLGGLVSLGQWVIDQFRPVLHLSEAEAQLIDKLTVHDLDKINTAATRGGAELCITHYQWNDERVGYKRASDEYKPKNVDEKSREMLAIDLLLTARSNPDLAQLIPVYWSKNEKQEVDHYYNQKVVQYTLEVLQKSLSGEVSIPVFERKNAEDGGTLLYPLPGEISLHHARVNEDNYQKLGDAFRVFANGSSRNAKIAASQIPRALRVEGSRGEVLWLKNNTGVEVSLLGCLGSRPMDNNLYALKRTIPGRCFIRFVFANPDVCKADAKGHLWMSEVDGCCDINSGSRTIQFPDAR